MVFEAILRQDELGSFQALLVLLLLVTSLFAALVVPFGLVEESEQGRVCVRVSGCGRRYCVRVRTIYSEYARFFLKRSQVLLLIAGRIQRAILGTKRRQMRKRQHKTNSPVPLALFIFHILRHVLQKVQSSTSRGYMIDDSCIAVGQGSRQQVRRASVAGGLYRVLQFFLFSSTTGETSKKRKRAALCAVTFEQGNHISNVPGSS